MERIVLVGNFLDGHLILKYLDFLLSCENSQKSVLLKYKLQILSSTNMNDYARKVYEELNDNTNYPKSFDLHLQGIKERETELTIKTAKFLKFLNSDEMIKVMKEDQIFNLSYIRQNLDYDERELNNLFHYAKFIYESGKYKEAEKYLYLLRRLSENGEQNNLALWGLLSLEILLEHPKKAWEHLSKLKDQIESISSPAEQLNQRSWLIHWGLFFIFKLENGGQLIAQLLSTPIYLNVVQVMCVHTLRYLIIGAILTMNKNIIQNALNVILTESNNSNNDIFLNFAITLFHEFDFPKAKAIIANLCDECKKDYFIKDLGDKIVENCKFMIYETYIRLNSTIDLNEFASELNQSIDDTEEWVVRMLQNCNIDALITEDHILHIKQEENNNQFVSTLVQKSQELFLRTGYLYSRVGQLGK